MNQTQCLGAVSIDLDGVKYRKYYEKNKKRLQSNTEGPATIYHAKLCRKVSIFIDVY
ncbi:hypothetical protein DsansV1_C10g0099481 [Dioscorea sansibarensis]